MTEKKVLNNTPCSGQEEMVHHFLDGALESTEREAFVAHLRHCSACQTLLAEFDTLFGELATLETVAAPAHLVDQVMGRLPAESHPDPALRPNSLGFLVVAGQIAIGLGLLLILLPANIPMVNSRVLRLPWLTLMALFSSLAHWLMTLSDSFSQWVQQMWPPAPIVFNLNVSPQLAIGLVAGFSLAWLAGNAWLLRRYPFPTKNGGT